MELTQEQTSFLKSYKPKDMHFTSIEEINEVSRVLDIANHKSLVALRNEVVKFYHTLQDKVLGEDIDYLTCAQKCFDYSVALMSVTAVIAHFGLERSSVYSL